VVFLVLMSEYLELLRNDPGERLAWLANSVRTPFTRIHSDNDSSYPIVVRNIGEQLAAGAVLDEEPVLEGMDVIRGLKTIATERSEHHSQMFLGDELAVAHAATVYQVCVSDFDTCLSEINP
jgi:hypothetical protein